MTLRHIKIFTAVFRQGGITKAARELHLAQPSVSLAIRELEEYYGVRLFERLNRHIYPTECGRRFYSYALHIVSLFDEMEQNIAGWNTAGTLKLGASMTLGTHILPGMIKGFQKLYPDLTINTMINKSDVIEQLLLNNSVDIGLIEAPPSHPDLICEPFLQDELCAIVPPRHPLCDRPEISLAQLLAFPLLIREKGSAVRKILDTRFSLSQLTPQIRWESASTQAIVRGVAEGLGVSILPYLLVKNDIETCTVIQIPLSPPMKRDLNLIYHKSKYLTPYMQDFLKFCKHPEVEES